MNFKVSMLEAVNKLFPLPVHPFNTQAQGGKTYAMWQYEKGEQTIKFYLEYTTTDEMFKDKVVLDVGCGAGGKSLYYLTKGAKQVIGIPWVQRFFSDKTLIAAYKDLVKDKPDGEDRIHFRIGLNEKGEEYFSYLNKMTIKRFAGLKADSGFHVKYYNEAPLRSFLKPLCFGPFREYFVKMVVCVLEKPLDEGK